MNMKRKLLLVLLAAAGLGAAASVPVRRTLQHRQPDGSMITVCMEANGRYVTYTTTDGLALMKGADGHFYYASPEEGTLQLTTRVAHEPAQRPADE